MGYRRCEVFNSESLSCNFHPTMASLRLALLATLLAVAFAAPQLDSEVKWAQFKTKFAKTYTPEEEATRKQVFFEKLEEIKEHNEKFDKGLETYTKGINQFSDLTYAEFAAKYLMKPMNATELKRPFRQAPVPVFTQAAPKALDYRSQGYVTPIKDQGQCGSCWAFGAAGAIEGAHYKATGKLVSLSEQNLMDCSTRYGNEGCNGGLGSNAFEYVIANKGIDTEASYPYDERDGTCRFKAANVGATISDYVSIPAESADTAVINYLVQYSPLNSDIYANADFQSYSSGVFQSRLCPTYPSINHEVLIVGYGDDYWLVKNSWGTSWGEQGYIRMARPHTCGISQMAFAPIA